MGTICKGCARFFCACCCQCCPTFEVAQAIEIGSAFRFECSAGVFSPASFFCFCTFAVIFETAIRSKQLITLRDSTQTQQTCHPERSVAPLVFPSRSGGRRVAMGPPRSTVSRAWGRGHESGRNISEGSALFLPMCWARSCQANPRCRHATKKKAPQNFGAPKSREILLARLCLFLVLQRIQRQRQTRLVPVRCILSQRALANRLVHFGKSP